MKLFKRSEIQDKQRLMLEETQKKELAAATALSQKLKTLNDIRDEYQRGTEAARQELAVAQLTFKTFLASREKVVAELEKRREDALRPLTEEIKKIEHEREAVLKERDLLGQLKADVATSRRLQREEETKSEEARQKFLKVQNELLKDIERKHKDAQEAIKNANALERLNAKNIEKFNKLAAEVEDKALIVEKAETKAKGLVTLYKALLDEQKKEQKKIDEKRKMLAIAINEFKKRGLWDKRLETKIK